MATKARHLKTAIQLWIVDNRKRLGVSSADLARWTGVTEDTARAWESRGRPSADAIAVLERRFGVPAPDEGAPGGDQAGVIAALDRQTKALTDLAEAIRHDGQLRKEWEQGFLEALRDLARPPRTGAPQDDPEPELPEASHQ